MGGMGSGSRYRRDKKTATEGVQRVDIRHLRKQGRLRWQGSTGSLSWSRGGEQTGSVRYRLEQDRLVLMYHYRLHGEDWRDVEEQVWFDRTSCNYGGGRAWFLCPHCGKRVAVLYGAGALFLCRHCYALSDGSQNETYMDRMMRKARKSRARLEAPESLLEPIMGKRKCMHWKTFERLLRAEAPIGARAEAFSPQQLNGLEQLCNARNLLRALALPFRTLGAGARTLRLATGW